MTPRARIVISYHAAFEHDRDPMMDVRLCYGDFESHDLRMDECDAMAVLDIMRRYVDMTALHELGGRPWMANESSLD